MKEDAQQQGPFSFPEQRGQARRKAQTSSPAPRRPAPPRLPVPSSLTGALLPPAVLPVKFQASPLVGSSPAPSPSRPLLVLLSAPTRTTFQI